MFTHSSDRPISSVDRASDHEPSMTGLVSGIVSDIEQLVEQQFALLRQETKEEMREALVAGQQFAVGALAGLLAGVAAVAALSLGLWAAVAWLPLWAGFTIVGSILAIVSGALSFREEGRHRHCMRFLR